MFCFYGDVPGVASGTVRHVQRAAETALKQGGGDPQGLNNGILYMLAMPYLLVGAIGFWWWKNRRRENDPPVAEMFEDEA